MLAIETATEACSVALFEDDALVDFRHEILGRGHAERLVPMIAELPGRGKAETIRVSLGPGSFTGVRIGLATARALGVAWRAEVRGFSTLALVSAMAQARQPGPVTVCMNGGHGQWFVQNFDRQCLPEAEAASLPPDIAKAGLVHPIVAGNRAEELIESRGPEFRAITCLPDAREVLSVPRGLVTEELAPLYGRAPDAAVGRS
ncbi:tRNA (adenosine(37)-N6)-threonylcarbamoyltransferase complex dimerization subunit type 1 TsaB [Erythrobacter litoralis]|uniref:tRNA (adenosine(37)-N6)-threonylcarbamoyltransferase complex dimerization subunit type 1 TsaB n=1 Tax=Erythrobacter litoralis TaxID=39960 RepID=UPI00325FB1AB